MPNAFSRFVALVLMTLISLATVGGANAQEPKIGIDKRVAWTTSKVTGSPDPPLPYVTERVFPKLTFKLCVDIVAAPDSDRLFVVEQNGKIFSFPNEPGIEQADLVLDFAGAIKGVKQTYSIAFHPDFKNNRFCYVCYIMAADLDDGTHIARFRMKDTDPPTIDVDSETTLITWKSGGHNGCNVKFGPDGYLYISTGDATGPTPPDTLKTGQDISDLPSSMLRIDVDRTEEGKNYGIPPDNPFVDLPDARGEIWAYGLRNPWRFSFDRKTGDLWVGDVGWEMWELLYRIERGGNYGWAVMEGRQSINPEWPRGPTPILPPTVDQLHSVSSSITDGLTYYGTRLPGLSGTHIYGDYDTGMMWGFRYTDGKVVEHRELADTTLRIVTFGETNDGEFLLLDHPAGTVHRLIPNPQTEQSTTFPRRLSDSGLFDSLSQLTPSPGVIPYSINAEPWADHAEARRFVAVPDDQSINAKAAAWVFPKDSVLVKTLSLNMRHGDPTTSRNVETQLLHFDGRDWKPYTYQWNEDQTDAALIGHAGAEQTFEITDPQAPGGIRKQTWRFSGRVECQRCHNKWSGPPLAFNMPQLERSHDYGPITGSQLDTLAHISLIDRPASADKSKDSKTSKKPHRLVDLRDPSTEPADRVRAYLHVNCSHCHRQHAGGAVMSRMQFDMDLSKTNMVGVRPSQGTFGIHSARVIAAGDPYRSVLLYRMSKLGTGRMPHIGSTEVDLAGVDLIDNWIRNMPADTENVDTSNSAAGHIAAELRNLEAAQLKRLQAKKPSPAQTAIVAQLLASPTGAMQLLRSIDREELPPATTATAIQLATRHSNVIVRDLFERFLPADDRIVRLGSLVQPEQILSMTSDLARGRSVFFDTAGVSCRNCHRIQKDGKDVGPELTTIGKKLSRVQLLESMLEPSKRIDPKFVTYLAETTDGRVYSGVLVSKDDKHVVLKDAEGKERRIPANKIEQLATQEKSLMPDLLLRDMTAQQVADLLAYLSSLK